MDRDENWKIKIGTSYKFMKDYNLTVFFLYREIFHLILLTIVTTIFFLTACENSFFETVFFLVPLDETPYILGSFASLAKYSYEWYCIFPRKLFSFKIKFHQKNKMHSI